MMASTFLLVCNIFVNFVTHYNYKKEGFLLPAAILLVGPNRLELSTSPLSGARSNQLSYGPACLLDSENTIQQPPSKINVFFNNKLRTRERKKGSIASSSLFLIQKRLTFAELWSFTSSFETVFLTFFLTGVTFNHTVSF